MEVANGGDEHAPRISLPRYGPTLAYISRNGQEAISGIALTGTVDG